MRMALVPWISGGGPAEPYANAFRANIKAFVRLARRVVLPGWDKAEIYLVDLELTEGAGVKLHIYQEHLQEAAVCDQCRCMGE